MGVPVALLQLRTPATLAEALEHAEGLLRRAAADGARFILTPEGTNILQRRREQLMAEIKPFDQDPVVLGLRAAAKELNVWLLIGSAMVLREDGKVANRSVLVQPNGSVAATYDKLHLFDVDLPSGERHRESDTYTPGERAIVAETEWAGLGMTICYDVRFPQLYRLLAKAGACMFAVPSAFTCSTGEAHWEVLLRARAIETGGYLLAPAQGGLHADGRRTWGRSMIVDPWGKVVAAASDDTPQVVAAELDLGAVAHARSAIPALTHDRELAIS